MKMSHSALWLTTSPAPRNQWLPKMWSTWFSVLLRYRIWPCRSAASRMATAFGGSCGVSMTTTPSDVTTKLGLQPRRLVVVKTLGVTRSIIETACCMGSCAPRGVRRRLRVVWLLRGGEATVDRQDVPGYEGGCVRDEEDG